MNQQTSANAMDVDQFGPSGLMMAQMTKGGATSKLTTGHYNGHTNELVTLSGSDHNPEMLRIIQQYLTQQGYNQVAEQLATASNVPLEEPVVSTFRNEVLSKDFSDMDIPQLAQNLVRSSSPMSNGVGKQGGQGGLIEQKREFLLTEQIRMIEYLLFEQKYMEAVEGGRTVEAIEVLQMQLYQRAPVQQRLHELA